MHCSTQTLKNLAAATAFELMCRKNLIAVRRNQDCFQQTLLQRCSYDGAFSFTIVSADIVLMDNIRSPTFLPPRRSAVVRRSAPSRLQTFGRMFDLTHSPVSFFAEIHLLLRIVRFGGYVVWLNLLMARSMCHNVSAALGPSSHCS